MHRSLRIKSALSTLLGLIFIQFCQSQNWVNTDNYYKEERIIHVDPQICDASFRGTTLLDFDLDGDIDVLYIPSCNSFLNFFENDGLGNFEVRTLISPTPCTRLGPSGCNFADLNGDGHVDVFYPRLASFTHSLRYNLNLGDGNFSEVSKAIFEPFHQIRNLAFGDLDNDGDQDILALCFIEDLSEFQVQLVRNDGNENFSIVDIGHTFTGEMHLADFDGNGYLDVVTTDLYIFYNEGGLQFSPSEVLAQGVYGVDQIKDINSDGTPDILVSGRHYLLNNGDRTFDFHTFILPDSTENNAREAFLIDLNLDGLPDQVSSGGRSLYIQLNQGNDTLSFTNRLHLGIAQLGGSINSANRFVEKVDFNGDGNDDIFTEIAGSNYIDFMWFEFERPSNELSFEFEDCIHELSNTSIFYTAGDVHWDFGNGDQSNEIAPDYSFSELGVYDVAMNFCDSFQCDTVVQTVEIVRHISDPSIPLTGDNLDSLNFFDNSAGFTNWTWVFGDGNISSEQNPSHRYIQPGTYLVELFVTSAEIVDCTFRFDQLISIEGDSIFIEPNPPIDLAIDLPNDPPIDLPRIYPNPSSTIVYIELSENSVFTNYDIVSTNGQVISSSKLEGDKTNINVSNLPQGLLLIKLYSQNESEYFKLVVSGRK